VSAVCVDATACWAAAEIAGGIGIQTPLVPPVAGAVDAGAGVDVDVVADGLAASSTIDVSRMCTPLVLHDGQVNVTPGRKLRTRSSAPQLSQPT